MCLNGFVDSCGVLCGGEWVEMCEMGVQIIDVCCDGELVVWLCYVKGFDYVWVGGDEVVLFYVVVGFDVSVMIWVFFEVNQCIVVIE